MAAAEGHTAVVDALLKRAQIRTFRRTSTSLKDAQERGLSAGGFTALMWAARNGHEDIDGGSLAAGADFSARNGDGATAMMITVVNDRFDWRPRWSSSALT